MLKTRIALVSGWPTAYHLGEGRVLKTICIYVYNVCGAYHLGEGRVLKTMMLTRHSPRLSVSPWGRARAQDCVKNHVRPATSVSPWGRARAQDQERVVVGALVSVSPWGRARAQDYRDQQMYDKYSVSPWGRARAQDGASRGSPTTRSVSPRERCTHDRNLILTCTSDEASFNMACTFEVGMTVAPVWTEGLFRQRVKIAPNSELIRDTLRLIGCLF